MRVIVIELIISLTTAFVHFSLGVIITRPENTALLQHDQLIFNCSSDALSSSQFVWYKINEAGLTEVNLGDCTNQPLLDGYRYEVGATSCNLVVDSVNASHAGAYRCFPFGEGQFSAALNVIGQLSMRVKYSSINATTGCRIILECKVTYDGYMIPVLTWSIPSNITETLSETTHASGESVSTLVITSQFEGLFNITCGVEFNASALSINDLNPAYMTSNITDQPIQVNFLPAAVPILLSEGHSTGMVVGIACACAVAGAAIAAGIVFFLVKKGIMSCRPNSGTKS